MRNFNFDVSLKVIHTILIFANLHAHSVNPAFAGTCLREAPEEGRYSIIKIERAQLNCFIDENKNRLKDVKVDAPGCFIELKSVSNKRKQTPVTRRVYSASDHCEKTQGQEVAVKIMRPCCTELFYEYACRIGPKPELIDDPPPSSEKYACATERRWLVNNAEKEQLKFKTKP